MTQIIGNLIVAGLVAEGASLRYSSTLARRTGVIIRELEEKYGPRNRAFTLLGLEFCETGPCLCFTVRGDQIIIQLCTSAMNNEVAAYYELAHECVHLLDPGVFGATSVFEEGVAASFSLDYARRFDRDYLDVQDKYSRAAELAQQALQANPNVIRELRLQGFVFSAFTAAQLMERCPGLSGKVASVLCSGFEAWNGLVPSSVSPS